MIDVCLSAAASSRVSSLLPVLECVMDMVEFRRQRRHGCRLPQVLLIAVNILLVNGFVPKTPSILYPKMPSNTLPVYANSPFSGQQNKRSFFHHHLETRATNDSQLGENSGSSQDASNKTRKRLKWKRVLVPKGTEEPAHLHDAMTP